MWTGELTLRCNGTAHFAGRIDMTFVQHVDAAVDQQSWCGRSLTSESFPAEHKTEAAPVMSHRPDTGLPAGRWLAFQAAEGDLVG